MTEDTGFTPVPEEPGPAPEVQPSPEVPAGPGPEPPAVGADPQEVAGEAAAAEPEDAAPPALPDPGWLLDLRTQFPGSALLEFIEDVHRRLRNLGG